MKHTRAIRSKPRSERKCFCISFFDFAFATLIIVDLRV